MSPKSTALALVLCLAPLPVSAGAKAGPAAVTVDGDRIRLGDLTPMAPRDLFALDVAPAPAPGQRAVVSRDAIRAALTRGGSDPTMADGLDARYLVTRSHVALSAADLESEIRELAPNHLPLGVSIATIGGIAPVSLPGGERKVELALGPVRRATRATMSVFVDGRLRAKQSLVLGLDGQPTTPQLRRDLPTGTVVDGADVEMQEQPLDALPHNAALRREDVVGRALTQPGHAGRTVQRSQLRAVPAISKGAMVRLLAVAPGIKISQHVQVMEDGALGDFVKVQTTDGGGKPFSARVVSPGEVRIDIGGAR